MIVGDCVVCRCVSVREQPQRRATRGPVSVRGMRALLLGAAAPFLVATIAHAEIRHVAITGADTNAGTAASPWRTIQRAANAVVPGDTVVIHAGTYVGFRVTAHGTQAAPITFSADGVVQIDG